MSAAIGSLTAGPGVGGARWLCGNSTEKKTLAAGAVGGGGSRWLAV